MDGCSICHRKTKNRERWDYETLFSVTRILISRKNSTYYSIGSAFLQDATFSTQTIHHDIFCTPRLFPGFGNGRFAHRTGNFLIEFHAHKVSDDKAMQRAEGMMHRKECKKEMRYR